MKSRQNVALLWLIWGLRLVLLVWLAGSFMPPRARAVLGEPKQVVTDKPKLCLHTRLIDEVYDWKIQRSLEMVRQMGAATIVEFFPWAYFEAREGQLNWQRADFIMRHAENQGLRILARMGFVPEWARPAPSGQINTFNSLPRQSYAAFGRFAAQFAARYHHLLAGIILWNEPNLDYEWGYRLINPAEYAELLAVAAPLIRQAAPDVPILGGALAPTREPLGSPHGLDDLIYLEQMLEAGAAQHMDMLAVHTYGFTAPATEPPDPNKLNFRRVELLHAILQRSAPLPIAITESGWNDHPRWIKAVSPSLRIQYTLDSLRLGESWDWLRYHCLWVFRFPTPYFAYPDHFAMATTLFQPLPIYYALRDYAQGQTTSAVRWLPAPR